MERGPYNNVSALAALGRRYDALTQNVANAATPGYRQQVGADTAFATALQQLTRVTAELRVDASPGTAESTGNPLDVALGGPGYLTVEGPDGGPLLTRRGDLRAQGGFLTLGSGAKVLSDTGPIPIPKGAEVAISESGDVLIDASTAARLRIVRGENLAPRGGGLYAAESVEAIVGDRPPVMSGVREGANVDLPRAMAELIATQRLFTTNLGAMRQLDQLDARLLRIRPV